MGIYCRKYIGGEFKTNQGYTATVIDGGSKNNYCIIDINGWEKEVSVRHLKCGNIKYPYHPNLFGVGYIGDGEYKTKYNKKPSKVYQIWHDMITRCYSRKYQIKKPSYKTCTVSKEWHNFQNFAKWFDSNYMEGFALDKDLLSSCKKIYSKETCVFIPHCLNSFMTNKKSSNKSECIGVSWISRDRKWVATIYKPELRSNVSLGYFSDIEQASTAYKKARTTMAHRMKHKMILEYGITDLRILDAIDKL